MARTHYPTIPFVATVNTEDGEGLFRIWPSVTSFNLAGLMYLVSVDSDPHGTRETGSVTARITPDRDGSLVIEYETREEDEWSYHFFIAQGAMRTVVRHGDQTNTFSLDAGSQELIELVNAQVRKTAPSTTPSNG